MAERSQVRMAGRTSDVTNSINRHTPSFPRNNNLINKFHKPEIRNVYAGSLLHSAHIWRSDTCSVLLISDLSMLPQYWVRSITYCMCRYDVYFRADGTARPGKIQIAFFTCERWKKKLNLESPCFKLHAVYSRYMFRYYRLSLRQ